jgi:hypothetical protein
MHRGCDSLPSDAVFGDASLSHGDNFHEPSVQPVMRINSIVKIIFRCLLSLIILAGFSFGGWMGAGIVGLTHDSDLPGSIRASLASWDAYCIFVIFFLLGIVGGVFTFVRPQYGFLAWGLVSSASLILAVLYFYWSIHGFDLALRVKN